MMQPKWPQMSPVAAKLIRQGRLRPCRASHRKTSLLVRDGHSIRLSPGGISVDSLLRSIAVPGISIPPFQR